MALILVIFVRRMRLSIVRSGLLLGLLLCFVLVADKLLHGW